VFGRSQGTLLSAHARIIRSDAPLGLLFFWETHGAIKKDSSLAADGSPDAILRQGFAKVEPAAQFHSAEAEVGVDTLLVSRMGTLSTDSNFTILLPRSTIKSARNRASNLGPSDSIQMRT